jgi:hypothetical protein
MLRGEPLDAIGLARPLKPYDIRPEKRREGDSIYRGHRRSDFEDAWARYTLDTPKEAERAEHSEHSANGAGSHVSHNCDVQEHAADTEHDNPHEKGDVPHVPHVPENPGTGEAATARRRLTDEEVQEVRELMPKGMTPGTARAEVLRRPQGLGEWGTPVLDGEMHLHKADVSNVKDEEVR